MIYNYINKYYILKESGFFVVKPKVCGKYHIKLNIDKIPIEYKYREGKIKSTLKGVLNRT